MSIVGRNVVDAAAIIVIISSELCYQKRDRPQFSSIPDVSIELLLSNQLRNRCRGRCRSRVCAFRDLVRKQSPRAHPFG